MKKASGLKVVFNDLKVIFFISFEIIYTLPSLANKILKAFLTSEEETCLQKVGDGD